MIRTLLHIAAIAVLSCVTTLPVLAGHQRDSAWNVDVGLGATFSAPSSTFGSVPGIASPGGLRYDAVNGSTMMSAAIGVDAPIGRELRLGLRASYTAVQHRHAALERAPIATQGGSVVTATMRHDLQGTFHMLGFEPYLRYDLTSWFAVSAGLPLMAVASSRYTQALRFVDPPGVRFVDGSIEVVTARGEVPNLSTVIPMVSFTIEGAIPASTSGSIVLVPRLSIARALQPFTTDGAFNAQTLSASLGLRYRFPSSVPEVPVAAPTPAAPPPPVREVADLAVRVERDTFVELTPGVSESTTTLFSTSIDTVEVPLGGEMTTVVRRKETYRVAVPKPPSVLRASLQLRFIDDAGTVTQNARLSAMRVESRRVVNFLPLIVFDADADILPVRYRQLSVKEARSWKESLIDGASASHLQYQILNILGSRMRRVRGLACTLVGYGDASRRALVEQRLSAIRGYLGSRFGIEVDRVVTEIRTSPDGDALLSDAIMIRESGYELLKPIEYVSTSIETQLPRLQLVPDVITEAGLQSWTIEAMQGETRVRAFAGSGSLPSEVMWDMNDDIGSDAAIKQPVTVTLRVIDLDNAQSSSEPIKVSLTSRMPLAAASRPLKKVEIFTFARAADTRQTAPDARPASPTQRQLAEWLTAGLEPPERQLYEQSGMTLTVQLLERR